MGLSIMVAGTMLLALSTVPLINSAPGAFFRRDVNTVTVKINDCTGGFQAAASSVGSASMSSSLMNTPGPTVSGPHTNTTTQSPTVQTMVPSATGTVGVNSTGTVGVNSTSTAGVHSTVAVGVNSTGTIGVTASMATQSSAPVDPSTEVADIVTITATKTIFSPAPGMTVSPFANHWKKDEATRWSLTPFSTVPISTAPEPTSQSSSAQGSSTSSEDPNLIRFSTTPIPTVSLWIATPFSTVDISQYPTTPVSSVPVRRST